MKSLSKNYIGCHWRRCRPSKDQKIKDIGTKVIDEDGLLQLLQDMPTAGGSNELAQKAMQKARDGTKIEEEAQNCNRNSRKPKQLQKTKS